MSLLHSVSLAIVLTLGVLVGPAHADLKKPPTLAGAEITSTGVMVAGGFLTLAIVGSGIVIFRSRRKALNSKN